ncbi:MAG TPA: glycosyltransferase family 9 protein [Stellaceae bacterium]|jgi:ADP-heptose:LPS heptosyltransferase|nr:glycosyltransferase family 9 protein [Stellaceae bacterium]
MLTAADFPDGTPLRHFFAWNARRWWPDQRYRMLRDPVRLAAAPTRQLSDVLRQAVGNPDIAAHAAVFAAFEQLQSPPAEPRRVLVIRLSAFGDFVQALGPIAAIRHHHKSDQLSLLTTRPLAGFAEATGFFDQIIVDDRPKALDARSWLALRRCLRQGGFDRVYDLQTSQRTMLYSWLLRPGLPEWSGVAPGCSHPHANLGRDAQHTLDKQAEQLLMAGVYPTPLPILPPFGRPLPAELAKRDFILLVPGSSPQHPEKRWPARSFGTLAQALAGNGFLPVIVGTASEAPLAAAIREACPAALDLVGRTDLPELATLAQRARLTIGNDTGVCHLAAAAACPLIVLFSRASDPAKCSPRGRAVRVLAVPDLSELRAATVIAAVTDVLARDLAAG